MVSSVMPGAAAPIEVRPRLTRAPRPVGGAEPPPRPRAFRLRCSVRDALRGRDRSTARRAVGEHRGGAHMAPPNAASPITVYDTSHSRLTAPPWGRYSSI